MAKTRYILTLLALILLFPTIKAEDVMEVWTAPGWNQEFTKTSTLQSTGNGVFTGTIQAAQYSHMYLMLGDKKYAPNANYDQEITGPISFPYDGWGRIIFNQEVTYTIKATLNADNSEANVEFLTPTPLTISIDGASHNLLTDVINYSGTIEYDKTIAVRNSSVTISGFTVGSTTYGAATQPEFSDESKAQSQTVALTTGGQAITLSKKGNYTISVTLTDGVPTSLTVNKAEMVPDVYVNSQLLNYADGIYSGTDRKSVV